MEENYFQSYEEMNLCKVCRQRTVDRSEKPDYEMCSECRNKHLHYPIPKKLIGMMIFIFLCVIFSYGVFVSQAMKLADSFGATKKADEGYVWTTLNALDEQMQENSDSLDLAWKMMEIAMDHSYYDYAAYIADSYLTGKEVSDTQYAKWEIWSGRLDRYYATNEKIEETLNKIETIDDLQPAIAELESLIKENFYDNALLYYAMSTIEIIEGRRMEHLENALANSDEYTYMSADLANIYRRKGRIEEAEALLKAAYEKDKEMAITQRGIAIIKLLQGNMEEAVSYAKAAYEGDPQETYVIDTYIVALALSGDKETAESVKKQWETEGYVFDEDTIQCMNEEISLQEYYMDEGGEEE